MQGGREREERWRWRPRGAARHPEAPNTRHRPGPAAHAAAPTRPPRARVTRAVRRRRPAASAETRAGRAGRTPHAPSPLLSPAGGAAGGGRADDGRALDGLHGGWWRLGGRRRVATRAAASHTSGRGPHARADPAHARAAASRARLDRPPVRHGRRPPQPLPVRAHAGPDGGLRWQGRGAVDADQVGDGKAGVEGADWARADGTARRLRGAPAAAGGGAPNRGRVASASPAESSGRQRGAPRLPKHHRPPTTQ